MQVDGKGRIWTAAWQNYPKWEPLREMGDQILILPDDDGDGVADRAITFAYAHNPIGFEFWNGGVIVVSQPELLFFRDTDGDDVADERIVLMKCIGSAVTHYAACRIVRKSAANASCGNGVPLLKVSIEECGRAFE